MRVVVGLGNPGACYAGTRHNIGWLALDALARRWPPEGSWSETGGCAAACARVAAPADASRVETVWFVKPLAYMNRSGSAFRDWWRRSGLDEGFRDAQAGFGRLPAAPVAAETVPGESLEEAPFEAERPEADWSGVLALVDDAHLPLGRLRLRGSGSDGGHNGLSDLIAVLDSERFARLRIGIGACPSGVDLKDWVLAEFFPEDRASAVRAAEWAATAAAAWVFEGVAAAQSRFNGPPPPESQRILGG